MQTKSEQGGMLVGMKTQPSTSNQTQCCHHFQRLLTAVTVTSHNSEPPSCANQRIFLLKVKDSSAAQGGSKQHKSSESEHLPHFLWMSRKLNSAQRHVRHGFYSVYFLSLRS